MVGGIVRDLILEKPNQDIDIVVEGDGIAFAKKIADIIGAEVISHDRFGTAKCKLKSGLRLDISTARMEYYDFPAALPIVERSRLLLALSLTSLVRASYCPLI